MSKIEYGLRANGKACAKACEKFNLRELQLQYRYSHLHTEELANPWSTTAAQIQLRIFLWLRRWSTRKTNNPDDDNN